MATLPDSAAEVSALRLAAWRQAATGDPHGAAASYAAALRLAPDDAALLTAAADAHRFTGELDTAIALFDRALALDPTEVAAWYGRALAHEAVGATAAARDDFARVTDLAPRSAPGFAGLAAAAARLGEVEAARAAARTALKLSPGDATTMITLARCDVARGRPAMAVERLEGLLARRGATGDDAIVALGVLGDALDRLGRVDAAFDAYASAKARQAARPGPDDRPVARQQAEAVTAAVAGLPPGSFRRPVPPVAGEAATHVFLLGYPRSGTTLVEQVLASAAGIMTLEEAPTLAAAAPYLGDLAAFDALDDAAIGRLRADYWARVAAAGAAPPPSGGFVDMDPFKSLALPLIARLFPAATVVHVRRDPRDVVWSCFRRSFVAGPVAAEFTTIARAAAHYAATMRLIETCRTALPLAIHDLRYEHLVADFDGATQRLCAATGIAWSPAMRDFAATARRRRVKTASAAQVRQPLFDGSGQWRRYEKYFAAALPVLAPWV